MNFKSLFFSVVAFSTLVTHIDARPYFNCQPIVESLPKVQVEQFSDKQIKFIEEILLPTLGKRLFMQGPGLFRNVRATPTSIEIDFEREDTLRFEWMTDQITEEALFAEGQRTVFVSADRPQSAEFWTPKLQRFLMGHTLHPFIQSDKAKAERLALGESEIILKNVQLHGIEVGLKLMASGIKKFLFVGPTAVGKTEVFRTLLEHRIKLSKTTSKKFHIVVVDQRRLADDLVKEAQQIQKKEPLQIFRWDDLENTKDIEALAKRAEESDIPTVFVTTIQSLRSRLLSQHDREKEEIGELVQYDAVTLRRAEAVRNILSTIGWDEAHHSGAKLAGRVIQLLIDHPDSSAFFMGTTATPTHKKTRIAKIFGNQAFYAYLDTPTEFLKRPASVFRPLYDLIKQLTQGMAVGELSLFKQVDELIWNNEIGGVAHSLFEKPDKGSSYTLKEEMLPELAESLRPYFDRHNSGFISVATIPEANKLAVKLNEKIQNRKFAVYHSDMKRGEIEAIENAFKTGEVNYLVTVQKLDEGLNFPQMSLFVDLNRSLEPRRFLQRVGRILRLFPTKRIVQIVTVRTTSSTDVAVRLENQDAANRKRKRGKPAKPIAKVAAQIGSSSVMHEVQQRLIQFFRQTPDQKARLERIQHRRLIAQMIDAMREGREIDMNKLSAELEAYLRFVVEKDKDIEEHEREEALQDLIPWALQAVIRAVDRDIDSRQFVSLFRTESRKKLKGWEPGGDSQEVEFILPRVLDNRASGPKQDEVTATIWRNVANAWLDLNEDLRQVISLQSGVQIWKTTGGEIHFTLGNPKKYEEVAAILKMDLGTLKSSMHRARMRLRKNMLRLDIDDLITFHALPGGKRKE